MDMHWVMTLQFETRESGSHIVSAEGVITPEPGQTRQNLFAEIWGRTLDSYYKDEPSGFPGSGPVPLLFVLEPNQLPVT